MDKSNTRNPIWASRSDGAVQARGGELMDRPPFRLAWFSLSAAFVAARVVKTYTAETGVPPP